LRLSPVENTFGVPSPSGRGGPQQQQGGKPVPTGTPFPFPL
jgi:hypothetical protein